MYVHRSNRTEKLVEILCDVVRRPLASPFERECIVVQGRGMERWLAMQLASRLGVWANPDFPFPRSLIERAFAAASGDPENAGAAYQPETMLWAVAELLPKFLDQPAFAPIRTYLADDAQGVRLLQLAERIATAFDQYVVYRPEMILGWQEGRGDDWQPILWRALVEHLGDHHLAVREARFARAIAQLERLDGFPSRLSLFGLSTLPPLYVRVLFALSRVVDVHLFLLSPSREYWAEIRSQREKLRTVARAAEAGREPSEDDLHLTEGNPLLASLGRLGRDFQAVLEGGGDYVEADDDHYVEPPVGTLLGTVQADVLRLRERRHDVDEETDERVRALPLDPDDRTIAVHSCHGPMREVEVLHDQLVRLFEELPDLQPRDVVVMTPSIDTYAPLVEAVFGEAVSRTDPLRPPLPFRIADRGVRSTDEIVDAFSRVLAMIDGRVTATEVLDLLRIAAVRRRFAIDAEDVDLLRRWVGRSGVRWGVDDAHRAELGQPPFRENTWRFGLDRLLLGHAMPGHDRELFAGVLPYDDVEGSDAELLGKLAELCETLFRFRTSLRTPRTPAEWRDAFGELLGALVASDDQTADQHNDVRKALARLADRADAVKFQGALSLDGARALVQDELTRAPTARGFLSGGITFCEMVPMRAIPFRVVCLLGMNNDAFPRIRRALGFDLVARHPRRGDRSSREDDRYLFLEALLSARDRLLITYVGQSIRDNAELPPSVVVSELLDTLGESFVVPDDDDTPRDGELASERVQRRIRERVVVRHPLQPFSTRYFSGDRELFSYARAYYDGASALRGLRSPAPPFVVAPLPRDERDGEAAPELDVDELIRFLEAPAKFFLQRRLQLSLGQDAEPIVNREPLLLDHLERWRVGDAILGDALDEDAPRDTLALLRARGELPLGTPGRCTFDDLRPEAERIAQRARQVCAAGRAPDLPVTLAVGRWRLSALLSGLYADAGHVRVQFSRLQGRSELGAWIRHLVLCCVEECPVPRRASVIGRPVKGSADVHVAFRPVDDPRQVLETLIELYDAGWTRPLPLFVRASRAYAESYRLPKGTHDKALGAARKELDGGYGITGEAEDPYVRLAFAGRPPLADGEPAEEFARLALAVFEPLLAHREVVR